MPRGHCTLPPDDAGRILDRLTGLEQVIPPQAVRQALQATGRINPMYTNLKWHGNEVIGGPFTSSQQAYETLHIGSPKAAQKLQARDKKTAKKG